VKADMMQQSLKKGPRWTVPRPQDQMYPIHNGWRNEKPALVLAFHIEHDAAGNEIGRAPHQMHLADAERVIREFPAEWSRFPNASTEPAPPAEPTPLDRLGELESELRSLQERVTSMRHELTGTGKS